MEKKSQFYASGAIRKFKSLPGYFIIGTASLTRIDKDFAGVIDHIVKEFNAKVGEFRRVGDGK